jgi:hypothetical protein
MRIWGLAVLTGGFLFPLALFAQHLPTPTPSPAHVTAPVTHVSSPSSTGVRASSASQSRIPAASAASSSNTQIRGPFSFLRRHEPISAASQSKCKDAHCSTNNTTAPTPMAHAAAHPAPVAANVGCRIVPVNNPAVPCNALAPCCP